MAKKSMILKQQAPAKFSTRKYNRCKLCGRPHAYLRDYGVCRICFRTLAYKGEILAASSGEKILDLSHAVPAWLAVRKVQRHPAASCDERVHSVIYRRRVEPDRCSGAVGRTGTVWEELSPCKASA